MKQLSSENVLKFLGHLVGSGGRLEEASLLDKGAHGKYVITSESHVVTTVMPLTPYSPS